MTILCALLAVACVSDYGRGKIPNLLVLLTALAGAGRDYLDTGPGGAVRFLICACCVMLLFYPFFRIGMMGAGDVKLLGAAAGYFPVKDIFYFLFFSMLIAAIISVIKLVREGSAWERLRYFCEYCADVARTGNWKLYFSERGKVFGGVCLSGPVLVSALLHWGGVY